MSSSRKEQGVESARKNLPALLDRANRGQTVVITKRGKPYAAIVAADQSSRKPAGIRLSQLRGSGKGLWGRSAKSWVEQLRKEW